MSQEASIKRRQVHLRRITCEGFEREDGRFDIEGTLVDTKPYSLDLPEKSLPAHAPIHEMRVRLTLDRQRRTHDAVANTVHGPYGICGNISDG